MKGLLGVLRAPDPTIPYIVCARPSDFRGIWREPGSQQEPCTFCGEPLVVAPSSHRMAPEAQPVCFQCVEKVFVSTEKPQ